MTNPDSKTKLDSRHVAHWQLQAGFVYFIGAGDPLVAIKVGVSTATTMMGRLRRHQSSNHEVLRILGLIHFEGMEKPMEEANHLEIQLHARFENLRRFSSGPGTEWLTPSKDLLGLIAERAVSPEKFGLKETVANPGPGLQQ